MWCLSPEVLGAQTQLLPRNYIFEPAFLDTMQAEIKRLQPLSLKLHKWRTIFEPLTHLPIFTKKIYSMVGDYHCDTYMYSKTKPARQLEFHSTGCRIPTHGPPPFSLVEVHFKSLPDFVARLPKIRRPVFVLSYGDLPIPSAGLPILSHPRVLRWFGTNVRESVIPPRRWAHLRDEAWPLMQVKMQAIPFGQAQLNEFLPSGWYTEPPHQEQHPEVLMSVSTRQPGCEEDDRSGRCNMYEERRRAVKDASAALGREPQKSKQAAERLRSGASPAQYFKRIQQHRFVLSPPGTGWDCTRTFHTIYAGSIPIINYERFEHEDVYGDLPVVTVDNWADVNHSRLDREWHRIQHGQFNMDKLWMPYWLLHLLRGCLDAIVKYKTSEHEQTEALLRQDATGS